MWGRSQLLEVWKVTVHCEESPNQAAILNDCIIKPQINLITDKWKLTCRQKNNPNCTCTFSIYLLATTTQKNRHGGLCRQSLETVIYHSPAAEKRWKSKTLPGKHYQYSISIIHRMSKSLIVSGSLVIWPGEKKKKNRMGESRKSDDQSETNFITENPPNILELVTEERRILMRNKIGVYKVIGSINQGKIKGLFIETYEWSYWITLRLFQPSILCDSNEKACCKENQNEINHMHLLRSLSLPTFLD